MKALRIAVLALVVLSVGIGGQVGYGQNDGQVPVITETEQLEMLYERMASRPRLREAFDRLQAVAAVERARDLGVLPHVTRNLRVSQVSGTHVFADAFLLSSDTNDVEAVGDVVIRVYEDGVVVSSMRSDQLTIGEGF